MLTLSFNFNWGATLVAAVLGFVLGNFWHHKKAFGKIWVEGHGLKPDHAQGFNFAIMFGLTLLLFLVAAVGLSTLYFNFLQDINALQGFIVGALIALFFSATSFGVTYIFLRKSLKVWLVDAMYYVFAYGLMGLLISIWK